MENNVTEKIIKLKREVDNLKIQISKSKGSIESISLQLKKYNINTIEEAKEKVKSLEKTYDKLESEINSIIQNLKILTL